MTMQEEALSLRGSLPPSTFPSHLFKKQAGI